MARFTIELRKETSGYQWVNTWHVEAAGIIAAMDAAEAISEFESALLITSATVVRRKVSPWPDPSGTGFIVAISADEGDYAAANPEPAEMCLLLNIEAATGRPGRKWLRLSLDESDVVQVAGRAILSGGSGRIGAVNTAAGVLETALVGLDVQLLIGSTPGTARVGTGGIAVAGIGFRDMDVGWYNRTAP